jgi:hypothetical protein
MIESNLKYPKWLEVLWKMIFKDWVYQLDLRGRRAEAEGPWLSRTIKVCQMGASISINMLRQRVASSMR